MELRVYIVRRVLLLIPVLFGVTLLIFGLLQTFSPVERATLYVRDVRQFGDIEAVIERYGLDEPVWVQYATWMNEIFHGNFGWSRVVASPVGEAFVNGRDKFFI